MVLIVRAEKHPTKRKNIYFGFICLFILYVNIFFISSREEEGNQGFNINSQTNVKTLSMDRISTTRDELRVSVKSVAAPKRLKPRLRPTNPFH